jgi:hypothetical protein
VSDIQLEFLCSIILLKYFIGAFDPSPCCYCKHNGIYLQTNTLKVTHFALPIVAKVRKTSNESGFGSVMNQEERTFRLSASVRSVRVR